MCQRQVMMMRYDLKFIYTKHHFRKSHQKACRLRHLLLSHQISSSKQSSQIQKTFVLAIELPTNLLSALLKCSRDQTIT